MPTTTAPDALACTIRAFIVDNFLLGRDSGFADDESLLDAGVVDSTGVMHIVAHLEEAFGLVVEDDELTPENLETVARIAAFVGRKRRLKDAA